MRKLEIELTDAEHFALFLAMGAWAGKLDRENRELARSYWTLLGKLVEASERAVDPELAKHAVHPDPESHEIMRVSKTES